jgi:type I restriction enzyme R subunit
VSIHKELAFEEEIVDYLGSHGWLYAKDDAKSYDRVRALFPADLVEWVKGTQPDAWDSLTKNHGTKAEEALLKRVREQMDTRGTLDVIRNGVDMVGLKKSIKLAEFKPALGLNAEILARYGKNRLRVVRQVHYSVNKSPTAKSEGADKQLENSIDLVLFLNGLPIATVELKTDFTQALENAVDQYRFDRVPHPKGGVPEPLLSFPNGALVHFAVSNSEVAMVTRLEGPATKFLPFNQGDNGGAGNPLNPKGHRTAYLWEVIWERESWLEIIGRYIITKRDKKNTIVGIIFPRFHQLDVTRELQRAVLKDGPGTKYLIQHSAGSGKTNSIAWTAHFLAELHDATNKKVFDTVIVVSDRTVIDGQLQEAIFDFERTKGVVATIKGEGASKSNELAEALSGTKKIVVCTIQTFPFALKAVRELAATEGKRFAVIADEAHSSQTGGAAAKLKELLSTEELEAVADGGEVSAEDILAAHMVARADDGGITFVAFTATPKSKTMELFGTRPDPTKKPSKDNVPHPFHVYSMRQAIEEEFILDVLRNYTSYSLAFKLAHEGKQVDEKEVDKNHALKKLMGWVKLHPYNITEKVKVVVEHYRAKVAPLLDGKAKAMVVVSSRVEAVRWKLAIEKYITSQGYKIGTLVAFSGEVIDKKSGPDPFTENSKSLNPNLKGRDIREAFKGGEYQVLLVANKFQTGFDQPLLCGMYVDKRLDGIQAVQTLSRLNRAHPGKDTTYVLDFANKPEDVLAAFKTYYETAQLETTTDPNLVLNLRAKLDATGHYDDFEVNRVVAAELNEKSKQSDLVKAIEPVVDRLLKKYKSAMDAFKAAKASKNEDATEKARDELDALLLFKSDVGAFVRLYVFLSQIFDYGNTEIEKRAIFFRRLLPLLDFGRERDAIDLSKVKLTHHGLHEKKKQEPLVLGTGDAKKLKPGTETGTGGVETPKAKLSELIEKVNELFDGELTDDDKLVYVNNVLMGKLLESAMLGKQAINNTKEQFAHSPDLQQQIQEAVIAALDAHTTMSTQALNSQAVQAGLKDILLNNAGLWEALRERWKPSGQP